MADPDPMESTRMSLGEHLEELRVRLVRGIVGLAIAFAVGWVIQEPIQRVILRPLEQSLEALSERAVEEAEAFLAANSDVPRTELFLTADPEDLRLRRPIDTRPMQTGVAEGFLVTVRIVFYFALFAGAPLLLWQLWQFVAAGLYPNERKNVTRLFPHSVVLFLAGVTFGYFVLVPVAMYFLIGFVPLDLVRPEIRLSEYFSLLTALSLAIGLIFQLPLLMTLLARSGIVPVERFSEWRRFFVLGAFVLAAMLTPPDPYTMMMMAGPTMLLYEIGVVAARAAVRRAEGVGEASEAVP